LEYVLFQIPDLNAVSDFDKVLILFVSLIGTGAVIGFFSTLRAIRRYLKMSLDELY
jgi:cell division transport system permease protein